MWGAFAKAPHIFSAKNISTPDFRRTRRLNESLTNDFVKLTMLWTTGPRCLSAGKELTSWLSAACAVLLYTFPVWCLEQDVEFDCICFWSLPFHQFFNAHVASHKPFHHPVQKDHHQYIHIITTVTWSSGLLSCLVDRLISKDHTRREIYYIYLYIFLS